MHSCVHMLACVACVHALHVCMRCMLAYMHACRGAVPALIRFGNEGVRQAYNQKRIIRSVVRCCCAGAGADAGVDGAVAYARVGLSCPQRNARRFPKKGAMLL